MLSKKSKQTVTLKINEVLNLEVVLKKNKKSKGIRIMIRGRNVIATYPYLVPKYFVEKFIRSKQNWIVESLAKYKISQSNKPEPHTKALVKEYSRVALNLVKSKLDFYNTHYNLVYKNISIKNQSTKWGSCSSKNNLNFNYRIVFLSEDLQDYLVVHELCHLKEMNHSKKFWDLVGETIPRYKELNKKLKTAHLI